MRIKLSITQDDWNTLKKKITNIITKPSSKKDIYAPYVENGILKGVAAIDDFISSIATEIHRVDMNLDLPLYEQKLGALITSLFQNYSDSNYSASLLKVVAYLQEQSWIKITATELAYIVNSSFTPQPITKLIPNILVEQDSYINFLALENLRQQAYSEDNQNYLSYWTVLTELALYKKDTGAAIKSIESLQNYYPGSPFDEYKQTNLALIKQAYQKKFSKDLPPFTVKACSNEESKSDEVNKSQEEQLALPLSTQLKIVLFNIGVKINNQLQSIESSLNKRFIIFPILSNNQPARSKLAIFFGLLVGVIGSLILLAILAASHGLAWPIITSVGYNLLSLNLTSYLISVSAALISLGFLLAGSELAQPNWLWFTFLRRVNGIINKFKDAHLFCKKHSGPFTWLSFIPRLIGYLLLLPIGLSTFLTYAYEATEDSCGQLEPLTHPFLSVFRAAKFVLVFPFNTLYTALASLKYPWQALKDRINFFNECRCWQQQLNQAQEALPNIKALIKEKPIIIETGNKQLETAEPESSSVGEFPSPAQLLTASMPILTKKTAKPSVLLQSSIKYKL